MHTQAIHDNKNVKDYASKEFKYLENQQGTQKHYYWYVHTVYICMHREFLVNCLYPEFGQKKFWQIL